MKKFFSLISIVLLSSCAQICPAPQRPVVAPVVAPIIPAVRPVAVAPVASKPIENKDVPESY